MSRNRLVIVESERLMVLADRPAMEILRLVSRVIQLDPGIVWGVVLIAVMIMPVVPIATDFTDNNMRLIPGRRGEG